MPSLFWRLAAVSLLLPIVAGCQLTEHGRTVTRQTLRTFKLRPNDYRDTSTEEEDKWSFVGKEGRGDRPLDDEGDPWKKFLLTRKARDIERNLGIK